MKDLMVFSLFHKTICNHKWWRHDNDFLMSICSCHWIFLIICSIFKVIINFSSTSITKAIKNYCQNYPLFLCVSIKCSPWPSLNKSMISLLFPYFNNVKLYMFSYHFILMTLNILWLVALKYFVCFILVALYII